MNNCIHRLDPINSEVYFNRERNEEKSFVKTAVASKECKRKVLTQITDMR